MVWTRIDITEACILGGTYHRLCRHFQKAFIAAGAPEDMALFAQTFCAGETRTLYLTPASHAHLTDVVFDGKPCAPPPAHEVTLVFGVPDAKQQLLAPFVLDASAAEAVLPPLRAQQPDWRFSAAAP